MCSMFCVLHVLVWNETSQMLTCFLNESQLRGPQHMQHYTHTRVCALWGETLRKLKLCDFWWMDWWKMKVLLFFSSSHLTHKSTHHVSPLLVLFHITQTLTFTDPTELITLLCAVRGGGGRKVMAIKQAWNIQHDVVQVGVHSSHRSHSSIHYPPESLYRLRWTEKGG